MRFDRWGHICAVAGVVILTFGLICFRSFAQEYKPAIHINEEYVTGEQIALLPTALPEGAFQLGAIDQIKRTDESSFSLISLFNFVACVFAAFAVTGRIRRIESRLNNSEARNDESAVDAATTPDEVILSIHHIRKQGAVGGWQDS
ncbi:MAG: hypothetical protein H6905_03400 [Hyphomicrobiales bacterium]|nr:hypothetical protein [Hyphomicrobiales bacterium]